MNNFPVKEKKIFGMKTFLKKKLNVQPTARIWEGVKRQPLKFSTKNAGYFLFRSRFHIYNANKHTGEDCRNNFYIILKYCELSSFEKNSQSKLDLNNPPQLQIKGCQMYILCSLVAHIALYSVLRFF